MYNAAATTAAPSRCTIRQFALYFLRLGTLGFGGPIALAGYMQRDLVEERGWIAPEGSPVRPRAGTLLDR